MGGIEKDKDFVVKINRNKLNYLWYSEDIFKEYGFYKFNI